MRKFSSFLLLFFTAACVFSEVNIGISGSLDWTDMRISSQVSLDLASAGLKLPAGRTQGETFLNSGYLNLIKPYLLEIQVDSSSVIGDLVNSGQVNLAQIEQAALGAKSVAPALTSDMRNIFTTQIISMSGLSSALLPAGKPSPIMRTLTPVSSAGYTGIIIIAADELPMYGMKSTSLVTPCLFPKIWDSNMNLIYERSMLEIKDITMVNYSSLDNIFHKNPTGLSAKLREIVGDKPLKIFARGVFGIKPTDLIIERDDAMLIISSEENRRLLSQGKVVIILDDSVLKYDF
ncbi:MAG: polymerase [Treponema sp.]|nr:polymerase [Treponema sp.]